LCQCQSWYDGLITGSATTAKTVERQNEPTYTSKGLFGCTGTPGCTLAAFLKKSQITYGRQKALSYNSRYRAKNKISKIMATPLRKGNHRSRGLCEVVDTWRIEFLCYMNGHRTAFAAISCGQF
jgi:hypothetical protein